MASHASARVTRAGRTELLAGIYVILNDSQRIGELAQAVLDGGVRVLQYRAKDGLNRQRLRRLRTLTRERDALLIVNDDWQAALEFDCDGVHLGPGDEGFAHVARVRSAMGERLIGLSCGTAHEVERANAGGADYLGIGSVFATASKSDAGVPIGLEGLRRLANATRLPVAAVGGITEANIREVRRSGVAMAAVISAVADAPWARDAARELVSVWS